MKKSELHQLIREEIQNEIQKATLSPGEDNMAPNVKRHLEDGDFEVITSKNLKVGDNIVKKNNMLFAKITRISGDKITFSYYEDSYKSTMKREKVELNFLLVV